MRPEIDTCECGWCMVVGTSCEPEADDTDVCDTCCRAKCLGQCADWEPEVTITLSQIHQLLSKWADDETKRDFRTFIEDSLFRKEVK